MAIRLQKECEWHRVKTAEALVCLLHAARTNPLFLHRKGRISRQSGIAEYYGPKP